MRYQGVERGIVVEEDDLLVLPAPGLEDLLDDLHQLLREGGRGGRGGRAGREGGREM